MVTLHQTLAAAGPAKHAGGGQHGEMGPGRWGAVWFYIKTVRRQEKKGNLTPPPTHMHTHAPDTQDLQILV